MPRKEDGTWVQVRASPSCDVYPSLLEKSLLMNLSFPTKPELAYVVGWGIGCGSCCGSSGATKGVMLPHTHLKKLNPEEGSGQNLFTLSCSTCHCRSMCQCLVRRVIYAIRQGLKRLMTPLASVLEASRS